jgi:uncharacterized protein with GYD domain
MATYISLLNWTDQGIRNAKDTVNRGALARKAFQAAGGKIINVYWTLGQHDVVVISELPNDESAFRILLAIGMQGNVRTTTMRAMGEEEMSNILQGIS